MGTQQPVFVQEWICRSARARQEWPFYQRINVGVGVCAFFKESIRKTAVARRNVCDFQSVNIGLLSPLRRSRTKSKNGRSGSLPRRDVLRCGLERQKFEVVPLKENVRGGISLRHDSGLRKKTN